MTDWAKMQAELLVSDAVITNDDIRTTREAIAEALWQAYENGAREGELRVLRDILAQVIPLRGEESK